MSIYRPKSGRYQQRIEIQEPVETQDPDTGEIATTWQTLALDSETILDSVPAEVLMGPGRENFAANAKQDSIDARITFRWFEGLTQKMRIIWDGRIYGISSLETDSTARIEWRLQCTAETAEGL